jgi:UDP-3-O-[3-hydroxymyristoyl] glucosamine N-acyltransferase
VTLRTGAIIEALGGQLRGDPQRVIVRLASLESARPDELAFLADARLARLLATTRAGCLIVAPKLADAAAAREHGGDCIIADDPHLYFARLTQLWKRAHGGAPAPGVHPSAVVGEDAVIDPTASIGALSFIGRGAHIGAHTVIRERVTVAEGCIIGARCLIQSGAVIGGDGFGFAPGPGGAWIKIEQFGAVRIGDDVEIGANTCIDRGALDDTVIEDGVKLDNLIQVGHNTHIGKHTAMAGCVGIAGSARIGAHCTVGGAGMISGHLSIADHVHVTAGTLVSRSIAKPGHYTGFYPFDDNDAWEKNAAALRRLHALRERVKQLEQRLEGLRHE